MTAVIHDEFVINEDERLSYHLLADSASAEYLWACPLDAVAEFGGAPVGLSVLGQAA